MEGVWKIGVFGEYLALFRFSKTVQDAAI